MSYICEYSNNTHQFYVTPSELAWSINRIAVTFGENPETTMFAQCDSYEEGFMLCDQMKAKMCYSGMTDNHNLTIVCSDMRVSLMAKFYLVQLLESSTDKGQRARVYLMNRQGGTISLGWMNISLDIIGKMLRFFDVVPSNPKHIIAMLRSGNGPKADENHADHGKRKPGEKERMSDGK